MKIALIQPSNPDSIFMPAIGLLYIAAILEREGFDVNVYDENFQPDCFSHVTKFDPRIVGFTCVTPTINRALKFARELKQNNCRAEMIFGGPHVTLLGGEVIKDEAVDFCIVREGEVAALELCKAIRDGHDHTTIKSLIYKEREAVIKTEVAPFLNGEELDSLPYPAYHLLELEKLFSTVSHGLFTKGSRVLPIMTTRGCPNQCTYCCRIMGFKIRTRSVDSVMKEIDYLRTRFNIDELYFEDDNFTQDRARAIQILTSIRNNHPGLFIKFANGLRVDQVDEEILSTIKAAGGYWVGFGIESGSPRTLDRMKKHLDLETARKNIGLAIKLGLKVGSNCIIGYPEETIDDIKESLEFFRKLNLDSFAIVNLIPFPGTAVNRQCKEKGYLTEYADNWDNYNFKLFNATPLIETPTLSKRELRRYVRLAYIKLYLSSPRRIIYLFQYFGRKLLSPLKKRGFTFRFFLGHPTSK